MKALAVDVGPTARVNICIKAARMDPEDIPMSIEAINSLGKFAITMNIEMLSTEVVADGKSFQFIVVRVR